jgi:prepilin-type N-terminal cleavage/methylation domain-containing protein
MSPRASAVRSQGGFTLTELLIVCAITGLVMAAVLGIYMQGSQSFLIGSARVETQENARTVLDTIVRELRTATAITAVPSATNMTFADQDGVVVQYQLSGTTLNRISGGVTTPLASGVLTFALTYYSAFDGATNTGTVTTVATDVHVVRVQLIAGTSRAVATGSAGDQRTRVESTVRLRNL